LDTAVEDGVLELVTDEGCLFVVVATGDEWAVWVWFVFW
jgi:hypothetical protein